LPFHNVKRAIQIIHHEIIRSMAFDNTTTSSSMCHVTMSEINIFRPTDILCSSNSKCALILLNGLKDCNCISINLPHVWPLAVIQVCADGAANRFHDFCQKSSIDLVPSIICGDLDSCDQSIIDHYKTRGTEIYRNINVDTTDFTKCVELLSTRNYIVDKKVQNIIAVGGLCGRFDHVMGCLQTLFLARSKYNIKIPLYLFHIENLVTLIPPGRSTIYVNQHLLTGKCGLVPLGSVARNVTTTGLQWNLKIL